MRLTGDTRDITRHSGLHNSMLNSKLGLSHIDLVCSYSVYSTCHLSITSDEPSREITASDFRITNTSLVTSDRR